MIPLIARKKESLFHMVPIFVKVTIYNVRFSEIKEVSAGQFSSDQLMPLFNKSETFLM